MFTHSLLQCKCRARIQSCHWFIQYPYRRIMHKRCHNHHLLSHAMGVLAHRSVQNLFHLKIFCQLLNSLHPLFFGNPINISHQIDKFKPGQPQENVRIICDISDRPLCGKRLPGNVPAAYCNLSLCCIQNPRQHLDHCCLTGSVLSDKSDDLSRTNAKIHVIYCQKTVAEHFCHMLRTNQFCLFAFHLFSSFPVYHPLHIRRR